jgi:hypothetical protein
MSLRVRTATADDLAALQQLVQERDEARYAREDVSAAFSDLDPERGRTWLAEADGEAAGTTSVVWRDLQGIGRAGYWTNLYVRPQYRSRMIYPLLVRKMQAALEAEGRVPCYCVVRRPRVLEGHLKLKFECVGQYSVMARPLRPMRLLQRIFGRQQATLRRRAIAMASAAARPLDALAVASTRLLGRLGPRAEEATVEDLVSRMSVRPRGSIVWSASQLTSRLRPAIDGQVYRALREGRDAALVWRLARRDEIETAVILDLIGSHARSTRGLVRAACSEAAEAGADVALWLDGAPEQRTSLRFAGFVATSERYSLIAWPPGSLDASALRFVFLDHDAF